MTYRNKGLRGFLALLMAALMVLGMCGFAFAADALEDVEVDETILIDEPTITDDTAADEPTDTDDAEPDEPTDADEAEDDEPDEDDVEVVTQKSGETGTLEMTKTFVSTDGSDLPLPQDTGSRLAEFNVEKVEESNQKAGEIKIRPESEEGNWRIASYYFNAQGEQTNPSLSLAPVTYELKETLHYDFSGYTFDHMEVKVDDAFITANNGTYQFTIDNGDAKNIEVRNVYRAKPGTFTITHEFVDVNGQPLPGPESTDEADIVDFAVYDAQDTEEKSRTGEITIRPNGDSYNIFYWQKRYVKNLTLAPGTYKLKETTFREVPGYDFDHWEVGGSTVQDNAYTFTITPGAATTLSIKNVYRVKTGTLTITKTFANLKPDVDELKFVLTNVKDQSVYSMSVCQRQTGLGLVNWTGTADIPIGTYKITEIGGDIEDYDRTTTYKLGNNGTPVSEDEFTVYIGAATSDYTTWTQVVANNSYSPKTQVPQAEYKVNYKLVKDGEMTAVGETQTYTAGDTVTLVKLPAEEGYTVTGWYDNGTFVPDSEANPQAPEGERGNLVGDDSSFSIYQNYTFYAYAEKDRPSATPKPVLPPRPIEYSAYLLINKVDAGGNPVAGAGFTVSNGSTTQGSIGLTDEQGQLLMGLLDTGDFTITETTVPEGYVAGEPVSVTVTSAHTRDNPCTVTIVNAKAGAQPTVSPTDAPTGEPTVTPTDAPTGEPTVSPADEPTARPTAAPTDAADGEDVPKTGDSGLGNLYALMCLSGLSAIALLLTHRRLRRS